MTCTRDPLQMHNATFWFDVPLWCMVHQITRHTHVLATNWVVRDECFVRAQPYKQTSSPSDENIWSNVKNKTKILLFLFSSILVILEFLSSIYSPDPVLKINWCKKYISLIFFVYFSLFFSGLNNTDYYSDHFL